MAKTKRSLKERIREKKANLNSGGGKRDIIFLKEGTIRVRPLSVGEDNDFIFEIVQFYLGGDIKGVYSPATFDEPCALMEKYNELKASSDDTDKSTAKAMMPKRKWGMLVAKKADERGKEVDTENSPKLVQLSKGQTEEIYDLFLDDEWGDPTDITDGYDLKLTRTGTGKLDTEYSATPCKNTPTPKGYTQTYNLEDFVRKIIPTYEETEEILSRYLNGATNDAGDLDEETPTKKKVSKLKKRKAQKD